MMISSRVTGLNKTMTSFTGIANPQQRNKMSVVKKIVMISSIKKEVKKIFLKLIDNGLKMFTEEQTEKILAYSKTILDNDKQKELSEDLSHLNNSDFEFAYMILKLVKYFVISPVEKSYIVKIEKQLREDEDLEKNIKQVEEEITEEKKKKLKVYELEKSGLIVAESLKKPDSCAKEAENFENKLMRANQKLNELSANNNKLREKINQLRKQKNAMEDIYVKLKKELQSKKQNVEDTIKYASQAYEARNKAEKDLKELKTQAEERKQQFRTDCQKLNKEIQHDVRFKQFIKSKQIEKEQLDNLEEQIRKNQHNIEIKKEENSRIDKEYKKSVAKEMEIKKTFDRIKKEIGIGDIGTQNEGKELLNIFINLYEKNAIMKKFVDEVTDEVKELEDKIEEKKEQIQQIYLKGSADECDKAKLNEQIKKRYQYQEKKKKILDHQLQKSSETIEIIKKYLREVFLEINVDNEVLEKLGNCNLNEENLNEFLAELQKKGLEAISNYGKLVSQQIKAEKGNTYEQQKQINELNNIITMENLNSMNSNGASKTTDYPSELIIKVKEEKTKDEDIEKPLTVQELKKFANDMLEQYQKKVVPKERSQPKKYNVTTINLKNKRR